MSNLDKVFERNRVTKLGIDAMITNYLRLEKELYTAQADAHKEPLTDEEIDKAWAWAQKSSPHGVTRLNVFARAVEKAHGIFNKKENT